MDTKLTLNLDKAVIEQAKDYAKTHRVSLSKLIESYLSSLASAPQSSEIEMTPLVKSLSGVIKLDDDFNYRTQYAAFLTEKYK